VANLLGEAVFQARRISLAPADLILSTVPAHHIYGLLFTVLAPLAAGARVVGGSPVFPAEIAAALDETGATVLVSVPAHYRLLADRLSRGTMLRLALSSAAPLPAADAEAFFLATGVPLEEIYGSTETGGIATRCRARGETALTPLTGLDWRIRDGHLRVRSAFLSPELPRDREGFFHTADRVAAVDAGGFVIRGRSDGIVKIAGRRVDLESVRRRILAIRGVREAVVFARPSEGGRQTEILALVQTSLAAAVIRARLQAELPAWAVPRTIRVTDRIPLAATGKFDRQAVAALFRGMERK
jgi:acyl-coenzyme A synthetase/AMP-(fatty) acid ligase